MTHHLDRAFATSTSQQVFEMRRRLQELETPKLNPIYRKSYRIAPFVAAVMDDTEDAAQPNPPSIAVGERK